MHFPTGTPLSLLLTGFRSYIREIFHFSAATYSIAVVQRRSIAAARLEHTELGLSPTTHSFAKEFTEAQHCVYCNTPTTRSPKSQKSNYFLINSLLLPAHSSETSPEPKYKEDKRTPVLSGCSTVESHQKTPIFDITKRSEVVTESDVARAPAQASVLSPHHTNGQESNSSKQMRKLKRNGYENRRRLTPHYRRSRLSFTSYVSIMQIEIKANRLFRCCSIASRLSVDTHNGVVVFVVDDGAGRCTLWERERAAITDVGVAVGRRPCNGASLRSLALCLSSKTPQNRFGRTLCSALFTHEMRKERKRLRSLHMPCLALPAGQKRSAEHLREQHRKVVPCERQRALGSKLCATLVTRVDSSAAAVCPARTLFVITFLHPLRPGPFALAMPAVSAFISLSRYPLLLTGFLCVLMVSGTRLAPWTCQNALPGCHCFEKIELRCCTADGYRHYRHLATVAAAADIGEVTHKRARKSATSFNVPFGSCSRKYFLISMHS
ncbi:unnamed protein product [Strongylus vulgaris]|uniref:Uncharacterized protein n=1 Tax=Strongylus vulgaris TaxID=40348 RepID=A0A3P7JA40_STRVU|nr:unnamed protein product [Strongylus vulgaris]